MFVLDLLGLLVEFLYPLHDFGVGLEGLPVEDVVAGESQLVFGVIFTGELVEAEFVAVLAQSQVKNVFESRLRGIGFVQDAEIDLAAGQINRGIGVRRISAKSGSAFGGRRTGRVKNTGDGFGGGRR